MAAQIGGGGTNPAQNQYDNKDYSSKDYQA